jgi:hypothetical protein
MSDQHITIDPVQEAKFIHELLMKEYDTFISIDDILLVTDAQVEYMASIGLIDKVKEEE